MSDIEILSKKIDRIDRRILDLLNTRARVVVGIGRIKRRRGKEVYAPLREKILLDRLTKKNRGPFPLPALRTVFREILSASRALQSPLSEGSGFASPERGGPGAIGVLAAKHARTHGAPGRRIAYLGPEATFTHLAALQNFGRATDLVPERSIPKVFDAVERDEAAFGVVPIENSTEGVVGTTLDVFLDSPLKVSGEIVLPVSHHLLTRVPSLRSIRRIYSHPQAAAQCRNWLDENLPNVPVLEVESTARAAERAAADPGSAGIAGEQAAELYHLKILRRHIEDNPNNMTRFLVIGRKSPRRSGRDKTSILFSVRDEAGVLYRMLEPFYRLGLNLTKIESRPLKKKAWEYIFFLDLEGHCEERKVKEAIGALERKCLFMKVLGSYPKAT